MTLCSFPTPLSSLSTMIAFYFFLTYLIPSATPLKFNFGNISDHQRKIILANNDSHFSSQGLQLTPDDVSLNREQRAGRATYIKPLHLWDSGSGELADFTTSFSFVISLSGSSYYADGLTFFLAENNSVITPGGCLGLPVDPATNVPVARFVAVEFDTYGDNVWDPTNTGDHVGIDINSLHSVAYEKWSSRIYLGLEYEATISYKAASKDLSVVFTGYQDTTKVQQDALHYTVDLRKELPEWVIFGFSASTGMLFETNTVKSWSFKSKNLHGGKAPSPLP